MSVSEFNEWQAFDLMSPIGGFRQDVNAGRIAQAIAIYSGYCTQAPPLTDCMLQYEIRGAEPDPEAAEKFQQIKAGFHAARIAAQKRAAERRRLEAEAAKRDRVLRLEAKRGNNRKARDQAGGRR